MNADLQASRGAGVNAGRRGRAGSDPTDWSLALRLLAALVLLAPLWVGVAWSI